ncbi:phosphoethanolamine transferase domain-containing protein [Campylobacter sp. VTCC 70190]|uniref:phosphoethanolamine transferase domain-containing protein n=1 Tax=Campylobacter sp. VTCC 70190 TaxID=3392118 RepID=UPI00398F5547
MLKISWFKFTLLNSILLTLLNFKLHFFVYEKLGENLGLTLAFIVAYFGLVHMILSLLFVKYLTKFFSIFFIIATCISVYFMSFYGILIDSDMILNVMQTDTKEVLNLLNWRVTVLALIITLFCILLLKIRIEKPNGGGGF